MASIDLWSPRLRALSARLYASSALAPHRVGADPHVFDEVRLYARNAHLDWVNALPASERERAILALAALWWSDAEANLIARRYRRAYALFLSIWEWDRDEPPCPYLFFCGSNVARVRNGIALTPARSQTARRLRAHLSDLNLAQHALLFEDRETLPGSIRVLIDFVLPCSNKKVRLDALT